MPSNWYMFFIVALIPTLVGMVYYNKNVMGNTWMKVNGFTEDSIKANNVNMPILMISSYLLAVLASFFLSSIVIHQGAFFSLMYPEALESGSEAQALINDMMTKYGDRHRGFAHGAIHGGMVSVFFILPIIAINALFEMRGWKYILIHFFYWLISLVLMGGVLCAILKFPPLS